MIYDCFTFFDELELLELRLHELGDVVDKFVWVEATKTHSNKSKPLHYQENRVLFQAFHDQIIHVVVDDMPDSNDSWVLENFQRNASPAVSSTAAPRILFWFRTSTRFPAPPRLQRSAANGLLGWFFLQPGAQYPQRARAQAHFSPPGFSPKVAKKSSLHPEIRAGYLPSFCELRVRETALEIRHADAPFPGFFLR